MDGDWLRDPRLDNVWRARDFRGLSLKETAAAHTPLPTLRDHPGRGGEKTARAGGSG